MNAKILLVILLGLSGVGWAGNEILYRLAKLDFKLYKENQPGGEKYWGGNRATELASFLKGGLEVQAAQKKIAESAGNKYPDRVFHSKNNGCAIGTLSLYEERPFDSNKQTFIGMFDPNRKKTYDIAMRFSNGVGISRPDKLPDVRGAAIKIFDVYNSQTGKNQNVDLLMTNSPRPFGRDFLEFVSFMKFVAAAGPTVGGVLFASHPQADIALLKATGLPVIDNYKVKDVLTERYWSGHPYLLGPNLAMKFNINPVKKVPDKVVKALTLPDVFDTGDDNYLTQHLRDDLRYGPQKFILALQLEQNVNDTPIEDNLVEWKESIAPSIPVGEIVLEQRNDDGATEFNAVCNTLRFTPGHYIPEHRPLSNMGRGRLFGYEASQIGRDSDDVEPDSQFVEYWRKIGTGAVGKTWRESGDQALCWAGEKVEAEHLDPSVAQQRKWDAYARKLKPVNWEVIWGNWPLKGTIRQDMNCHQRQEWDGYRWVNRSSNF